MSQETDARNANSDNKQDSADAGNEPTNAIGLTDEERTRYGQVQAEINAMILLEEEKERWVSGAVSQDVENYFMA